MTIDPDNNNVTRRQFISRAVMAGASIAAAGATGFWFHDTVGPGPSEKNDTNFRLPDFSIPELGPKMSVVRGQSRSDTLRLALKSIGGIETYIKKGDRVLLKVNAAFATPQMLSATTHPEIVSEVTRLCLEAGASAVIVSDNPINNPGSCFTESIPLVFALSVLNMEIGIEEAVTAMTINGAAALDRADIIGSIDPGKQADLIVLEFPSYSFIPYHIGVSTVEKVIKRGAIVFDKTRHKERDDVC